MISVSKKHFFIFLLTVALASLPSCLGQQSTTIAKPAATSTPTIAQSNAKPAATSAPTIAQSNSDFQLGIPIDCNLGKDCFIMHHLDRDPGPEAVDFNCGRLTYDEHNGTDFAIPDEKTMAAGVAVKASAAGKVLRVRDGEPDRRVEDQTTKDAVEGKECGNGVVIEHANGWQTQYCHLRNGSVVAQPGSEVEKGAVLGMIGSSGLASFPHVHLSVRYQGKVVDPFVGPTDETGCKIEPRPIWDQPITYTPTGLIRAGFSTQPPKMNELWEGRFTETTFPQDSPALLFWVQAYGVLKGDTQQVRIFAPDGKTIVDDKREVNESNRVWMNYAGKRNNKERPLIPGVWRGEYQLMRGDRVLIDVKREVELQ